MRTSFCFSSFLLSRPISPLMSNSFRGKRGREENNVILFRIPLDQWPSRSWSGFCLWLRPSKRFLASKYWNFRNHLLGERVSSCGGLTALLIDALGLWTFEDEIFPVVLVKIDFLGIRRIPFELYRMGLCFIWKSFDFSRPFEDFSSLGLGPPLCMPLIEKLIELKWLQLIWSAVQFIFCLGFLSFEYRENKLVIRLILS